MSASADRGRRVGRFEIVTRLQGGAVTDLFLARLVSADGSVRFVALKQLRAELRRDEAITKQFFDDARVTAGLVHGNVGRVFEVSIDSMRRDPYVAMEFITGQDLASFMEAVAQKGLQLPFPVACRIVHDLCVGLHAGHMLTDASGRRLGVVHGDVTPRNVMVSYAGRTKVVDFGVAQLRRSLRQAFPGQLFGTLAYLGPEQVLEHPVDARTDVFAAATILFELLTGRRMFANEAMAPRAVVIERPPPPSSLAADVTPQLDTVVLQALEKNPDDRPASAAAFARALAAAVQLAEEKDVADLMRAFFEDRQRQTEELLELWSSEGEEEPTVSMALPAGVGLGPAVDPSHEVTRVARAVPEWDESPEATQQMPAVSPPVPSPRAPPRRAPLPPPVEDAPPPPAVSPRRSAPRAPPPASAPRAPASAPRAPPPASDLWAPPPPPAAAAAELWAPPPPPAAGVWASPPPPAAPAAALWAPPPPPAAPAADLWAPPPPPAAPAADLWAPPPPPASSPAPRASAPPPPASAPPARGSAPPAPAPAPQAPAPPPAAPAPDAAPPKREPPPPAPKPQAPAEEEELPHGERPLISLRVRWVIAIVLSLIAAAVVTSFIKNQWLAPPNLPPVEKSGARPTSSPDRPV